MKKKILKYKDFMDKELLESIAEKLKDKILFPEKLESAKKFLENVKQVPDEFRIDKDSRLPTYEECVEMCSAEDSPFYETKTTLEGFPVSMFNYRLASSSDFLTPKSREMRGITFVFNEDGSLYKRFLLLEKFFNLNQVPDSMYSIVKDYKIKFVNNKEDGSVASFIKLPNGSVYGKSKMSFESEQSIGITRIYQNNLDVKTFVDLCLDSDITAVFEYVAPHNRIVLRYSQEELILLRLRDNNTGKHIDIKDYLDKIGSIKVAPFKDDFNNLDELIELTATEVDKEGYVVHAEDKEGNDFFFKLKTPWYCSRHSIITNDIYQENLIIELILDDKIDDILGQIQEEEKEAHEKINKIISVVKKELNNKIIEYNKLYKIYLSSDSVKSFALKYKNDPSFSAVMQMSKLKYLQSMSEKEIEETYSSFSKYEEMIKKCEPNEIAKESIRNSTKKLLMARKWLSDRNKSIFFKNQNDFED